MRREIDAMFMVGDRRSELLTANLKNQKSRRAANNKNSMRASLADCFSLDGPTLNCHALPHKHNLSSDIIELVDNNSITSDKPVNRIFQSSLFAELDNVLLCSPEVVSWNSREKMVNSLVLKPTMKEIKPIWAVNIHSGSHLPRDKALAYAQV